MYVLVVDDAVSRYPYSVADLRADNPQVSFPSEIPDSVLSEFGVLPVAPTQPPTINPATQAVVEVAPELVDGVWVQSWGVRALTPAEAQQYILGLQADIVERTQKRLDDFARTRNYDGILSLCTYATSTVVRFQAEGQYGVNARDDTWATLYDILGDIEAGARPMPNSFADIEPDLPVLAWPT